MSDLRDFRGPLPLTDADFARIRANVLAEVRPRRRPFAFALRFAFAALMVAFAGAVSWNALRVPAVDFPPPSQPQPHITRTFPVPPLPAAEGSAPSTIVRRVPRRLPAVEPVAAPLIVPPPLAQPVRMEIQTADPDIRIIWLPNQLPEEKS